MENSKIKLKKEKAMKIKIYKSQGTIQKRLSQVGTHKYKLT